MSRIPSTAGQELRSLADKDSGRGRKRGRQEEPDDAGDDGDAAVRRRLHGKKKRRAGRR